MMINAKTWTRWLAPLALALAAGCAPTYHSYSGCKVGCQYCAPPPLPFAHYDGCVCHSCAVSGYLLLEPLSAEANAGTDTDE
jgi:hypothetical protein